MSLTPSAKVPKRPPDMPWLNKSPSEIRLNKMRQIYSTIKTQPNHASKLPPPMPLMQQQQPPKIWQSMLWANRSSMSSVKTVPSRLEYGRHLGNQFSQRNSQMGITTLSNNNVRPSVEQHNSEMISRGRFYGNKISQRNVYMMRQQRQDRISNSMSSSNSERTSQCQNKSQIHEYGNYYNLKNRLTVLESQRNEMMRRYGQDKFLDEYTDLLHECWKFESNHPNVKQMAKEKIELIMHELETNLKGGFGKIVGKSSRRSANGPTKRSQIVPSPLRRQESFLSQQSEVKYTWIDNTKMSSVEFSSDQSSSTFDTAAKPQPKTDDGEFKLVDDIINRCVHHINSRKGPPSKQPSWAVQKRASSKLKSVSTVKTIVEEQRNSPSACSIYYETVHHISPKDSSECLLPTTDQQPKEECQDDDMARPSIMENPSVLQCETILDSCEPFTVSFLPKFVSLGSLRQQTNIVVEKLNDSPANESAPPTNSGGAQDQDNKVAAAEPSKSVTRADNENVAASIVRQRAAKMEEAIRASHEVLERIRPTTSVRRSGIQVASTVLCGILSNSLTSKPPPSIGEADNNSNNIKSSSRVLSSFTKPSNTDAIGIDESGKYSHTNIIPDAFSEHFISAAPTTEVTDYDVKLEMDGEKNAEECTNADINIKDSPCSISIKNESAAFVKCQSENEIENLCRPIDDKKPSSDEDGSNVRDELIKEEVMMPAIDDEDLAPTTSVTLTKNESNLASEVTDELVVNIIQNCLMKHLVFSHRK